MGGACVECTTNSYCTLPTAPICAATGACSPCVWNNCPAPKYCDSSGACVQCLNNGHCSAPTPYCVGNVCKKCLGNSVCGSTTPICSNNDCVACITNNCPFPTYCAPTGACVECLNDGHCSVILHTVTHLCTSVLGVIHIHSALIRCLSVLGIIVWLALWMTVFHFIAKEMAHVFPV